MLNLQLVPPPDDGVKRIHVRELLHLANDPGGPATTPIDGPLILDSIQLKILDALKGRAMRVEKLAREVCEDDASRLYARGGQRGGIGRLKEMLQRGLISYSKKIGYYRLDAAPAGVIQVPRTTGEQLANNQH